MKLTLLLGAVFSLSVVGSWAVQPPATQRGQGSSDAAPAAERQPDSKDLTGKQLWGVISKHLTAIENAETDAQREAGLAQLFEALSKATDGRKVALRFRPLNVNSKKTGFANDPRKTAGATLPIPGAHGYGIARARSDDGIHAQLFVRSDFKTFSDKTRATVDANRRETTVTIPLALKDTAACARITRDDVLLIRGTLLITLEKDFSQRRAYFRNGQRRLTTRTPAERLFFPPVNIKIDWGREDPFAKYRNEPLYRAGKHRGYPEDDKDGVFQLTSLQTNTWRLRLVMCEYSVATRREPLQRRTERLGKDGRRSRTYKTDSKAKTIQLKGTGKRTKR